MAEVDFTIDVPVSSRAKRAAVFGALREQVKTVLGPLENKAEPPPAILAAALVGALISSAEQICVATHEDLTKAGWR